MSSIKYISYERQPLPLKIYELEIGIPSREGGVFPVLSHRYGRLHAALLLLLALSTTICAPQAGAVKLSPEAKAEEFFEKGHEALDKGKGIIAEKFYRKALELNPDEGRYHRQLALILIRMGRGQEAERELAFAVSHDPHDWRAMLMQGTLAHAQKRYDAEAAIYKKILKVLPESEKDLRVRLEKFIADDEAHIKKAQEIARKKKALEDEKYKW